MENNGLYLLTIEWYNDCEDKDERHTAFCIAENFAEAVRKAEMDFNNIMNIHIEEVIPNNYVGVNLFYVPEDEAIIEAIKRENDY